MKEFRIRMHPPICRAIFNAGSSGNYNDEQLKELILSEIKTHLIDIMKPGCKTKAETNEMNEKYSQIKESSINSKERKDWINDYGVFFKIAIPDELFTPKVHFYEFEIEEITDIQK